MSLETTFHPLCIAEVRRETADAVSIRFEVPADLAQTYAFKAGQHLTVRRSLGGEDVRRNYSVCAAPRDGELRIAIKAVAGGRFSSWANSELAAGDVLEVMAPQGHFTWPFDAGQSRTYLGIAGGSGITPVLSILKTVLSTEPKSRFILLYGNRCTASIMFLEELAGLKNRYLDRLQIFHFLEDESDGTELFHGRLDAERCSLAFNQLVDVAGLEAAFVCGPGPMMDAAQSALSSMGLPADRTLVERFQTGVPSAAQAAASAVLAAKASGARVSVILDGRRATVAFDPARGAILDNVRAAGLPAPYACKGGVCATCRAKVTSGSVEMALNYGLSPQEVAQGYVLTCQSIPTSDGVTIDYDA